MSKFLDVLEAKGRSTGAHRLPVPFGQSSTVAALPAPVLAMVEANVLDASRATTTAITSSRNGQLPPLHEIENAAAGARQQVQTAKGAAEAAVTKKTLATLDVRMDQSGTFRLLESSGGRLNAPPLASAEAVDHLISIIQKTTGKAPGREVMDRELAGIRAQARATHKRTRVFTRSAHVDGTYLLDLGNVDGEVIRIDSQGWRVETNKTIPFLRGGSYGTLPTPVQPASDHQAWEVVSNWFKSKGISANLIPALVVMVTEWIRSNTPNPICEIIGPAGSAKTTFACQLAALIDPSSTGRRPNIPAKEADIAAAAPNMYVLLMDNISKLTADEQDLLCRVSTGVTLAFRKLYEQDTLYQSEVMAPVIGTGIQPFLTRGDAISRAVRAPLPRRASYIGTAEIGRRFTEDHPALLGALCTLLSVGLRMLPTVVPQRSWNGRMVDYAQLGEAIMQGCGFPAGAFVQNIEATRKQAAAELANGDPFTKAVVHVFAALVVEAKPLAKFAAIRTWARGKNLPGYTTAEFANGNSYLCITSTALLARIKTPDVRAHVGSYGFEPESERALNGAMIRITPILHDLGITADSKDFGGYGGWILGQKIASDV